MKAHAKKRYLSRRQLYILKNKSFIIFMSMDESAFAESMKRIAEDINLCEMTVITGEIAHIERLRIITTEERENE